MHRCFLAPRPSSEDQGLPTNIWTFKLSLLAQLGVWTSLLHFANASAILIQEVLLNSRNWEWLYCSIWLVILWFQSCGRSLRLSFRFCGWHVSLLFFCFRLLFWAPWVFCEQPWPLLVCLLFHTPFYALQGPIGSRRWWTQQPSQELRSLHPETTNLSIPALIAMKLVLVW